MVHEVTLFTRSKEVRGAVERSLATSPYRLSVFEGYEGAPGSDVALLDVDSLGIGLLSDLRRDSFVVILTSERGAKYLIESMTFGAFDCVFFPPDAEKLVESIDRAAGIREELRGSKVDFPGDPTGSGVTCAIVGDSHELQEVCKIIGSVGRVNVPVLITGESGTGKELVAESIWKVSTRWEKPFVVLNCAAIPEPLLEAELFGYEKGSFTGATSSRKGKFEEADGGIIFLDEIGDMSLSLQAKVLRVLQNGTFHRIGDNREIKIDLRVIAATNKALAEMVMRGEFREDLYFRLNVVSIKLPPLRERKDDIRLLVECFVRRHSVTAGKKVAGVTEAFLNRLIEHNWPGNIRELENVVRKAIVFAKSSYLTSFGLKIETLASSPDASSPNSGTREGAAEGTGFEDPLRGSIRRMLGSSGEEGDIHAQVIKETERIVIEEALNSCDWNRSRAARILGINRLTLRRKVEEYGLEPKRIAG